MSAESNALQVAEVVGTWFAAITVVVGGVFGFYQYSEYKADLRADRTLSFVERYYGDDALMHARIKVAEAINANQADINAVLQDPTLDAESLPRIYDQAILDLIEREALAGSLEQVFTFYEQVILCTEMMLCDSSVAKNFFDFDGQDFIRTFYPYICDVRHKWQNPEQYQRVVQYYLGEQRGLCSQGG